MIQVKIKRRITRIGVVTDTHIPTRGRFLPPVLFHLLAGSDLILHAGDIVVENVLEELSHIAPVEAVAGNMDPLSLQEKLGRCKLIQTGAVSIGLVHGDGAKGLTPYRAFETFARHRPEMVVFGHSHLPLLERREGVILFNPGSPVDPRRNFAPSCGVISLEGSFVHAEIVYLPCC